MGIAAVLLVALMLSPSGAIAESVPVICVPIGFPPILELKVDRPPQVFAISGEDGRLVLILSQHYEKGGNGYVVGWVDGMPLFVEDDDPKTGVWFDAALIVRKDGHYYLRVARSAAPCQWQYVPPSLSPPS